MQDLPPNHVTSPIRSASNNLCSTAVLRLYRRDITPHRFAHILLSLTGWARTVSGRVKHPVAALFLGRIRTISYRGVHMYISKNSLSGGVEATQNESAHRNVAFLTINSRLTGAGFGLCTAGWEIWYHTIALVSALGHDTSSMLTKANYTVRSGVAAGLSLAATYVIHSTTVCT